MVWLCGVVQESAGQAPFSQVEPMDEDDSNGPRHRTSAKNMRYMMEERQGGST